MVDLPVNAVVDELKQTLNASTTALLVAPPGAGKTTFVPLQLLDELWLNGKKIVMLEPRRLATRAAALRMAATLGEEVGVTIGYQTRDERVIGANSRIEVVTEGVLTRRIQNDPTLSGVGLIIFDEVHERNLPTDLGIALTLDVMGSIRTDLRLLAMSATADATNLSTTLTNQDGLPAPIVESKGRQFPVEIIWEPRGQKEWLEPACVRTITRALNETTGDILVFLPGIGEINRVQRDLGQQLTATKHDDVQILRLAGALAQEEQDSALRRDPVGRRRIVLSTDIAETSLTVDGVSVVVDAGLARVPRFDSRTGMTRLTTISASRANTEQRAGRAGRTEPGVAYRMWSKIEHTSRRAHLQPEIKEAELTGLVLDAALWGTPIDKLKFPDAPAPNSIRQARELLSTLGALDNHGKPTERGRSIASLPLHPRLATMVIGAEQISPEHAWAACLLATIVDERDFIRTSSDPTPTDLNLRLEIIDGVAHHRDADMRTVSRVIDRARDVARRAGISTTSSIPDHCAGRLALLAYPDRLASKRSGVGQFQLRGGNSAWLPKQDPLAEEQFVVAVDLDGDRKNARIRLCASLTISDLELSCGDRITKSISVAFDKERGDIVSREEIRLDNMKISTVTTRPSNGAQAIEAIIDRVRSTKLSALKPNDEFQLMRRRMSYLHKSNPSQWPDWSDESLVKTLDLWLKPFITSCRDLADVAEVDLSMILQTNLSWDQSQSFAELAPIIYILPNGKTCRLEYPPDSLPMLRVRVQDLYGINTHPCIVSGTVPLLLELLSPANRPIQVTSDLPRFWAGSWKEVRKDMAGRYPKHFWPEDPATATAPK